MPDAWTVFDWDDETTWPPDDPNVEEGASAELLMAITRPDRPTDSPTVAIWYRKVGARTDPGWARAAWDGTELWDRESLEALEGPDARIIWAPLPHPDNPTPVDRPLLARVLDAWARLSHADRADVVNLLPEPTRSEVRAALAHPKVTP